MGKPAARLGDMHVCPAWTGNVPHVGGPISGPGCPTVLVGGAPAAVMGDMCVCNGPPDTVVLGSTGVFFGGKPAARLGDSCAHGGKIVVGCPTVLIGDNSSGMPLSIMLEMVKVVPVLAQKAAMKQAAETGAPFCEKCEAMKKADAADENESADSEKVAAKANEVYTKAKAEEPKTTADIVGAGEKNGGKPVGLDYKLKSEESLARKIETDGIDKPIKDSLRYTVLFDKDQIADGSANTIKDLESKGYKKIGLKNTFQEGAIYKGINSNFETPNGQIIEVQFHTPESFNVKQNVNHPVYEEYRLLDPRDPKAVELKNQMIANSDTVDLPPNIEKVK